MAYTETREIGLFVQEAYRRPQNIADTLFHLAKFFFFRSFYCGELSFSKVSTSGHGIPDLLKINATIAFVVPYLLYSHGLHSGFSSGIIIPELTLHVRLLHI